MSDSDNDVKIFFNLEIDDDRWPPCGVESVWATALGDDRYRIENIPFHIKDLSHHDVVHAVRDEENILIAGDVVERGGSSTIRLIVFDCTDEKVESIDDALHGLGSWCEYSKHDSLIAIDIPPESAFVPVHSFVAEGFNTGRWDYEESYLAPHHLAQETG